MYFLVLLWFVLSENLPGTPEVHLTRLLKVNFALFFVVYENFFYLKKFHVDIIAGVPHPLPPLIFVHLHLPCLPLPWLLPNYICVHGVYNLVKVGVSNVISLNEIILCIFIHFVYYNFWIQNTMFFSLESQTSRPYSEN